MEAPTNNTATNTAQNTPTAAPSGTTANPTIYDPNGGASFDAPKMADGGTTPPAPESTGNDLTNWLKSLNWIEISFLIAGGLALVAIVDYYRTRLTQNRVDNNDMAKRLDEMEMNLRGAMKGKYKSFS